MMRFFAEAGNSCLAMSSLILFLTVYWLIEVRSFDKKRCRKVAAKLLFGRGRSAKQLTRRLCRPL